MKESIIIKLLAELGFQAYLIIRQYRLTGKIQLTPMMRKILELVSREKEILDMYGTSIEEVDQQLAEHEKE